LYATDRAQQWAYTTWQENQAYFNDWNFGGDNLKFSAEDLLKFESFKDFDISRVWHSISTSTKSDFDRQALAFLLEKTVVTGY
jgi:hypothetical protein